MLKLHVVYLLTCTGYLLFFPQDGATPLFKACHKGHLDVAEQLLKHKPNLGLLQVWGF